MITHRSHFANRRVLVVGNDEHAAFVSSAIEKQGGRVVPWDPTSSATVSVRDGVVAVGGERVDDVSAAYVKALPATVVGSLPSAAEVEARAFASWTDRYTAARERHSFVVTALKALHEGGVVVVNPVHTFELHTQKAHQITVLRRAKVPVPSTLATTDPAAVRAFAEEHRAAGGGFDVIYKPLSGGAGARLLVDDDLDDDRLASLASCPALFQERIAGAGVEELRLYVLDGKPLAAYRVPTAGAVDARENIAGAAPVKLASSSPAWKTALRAVKACALVFAAVDMRVKRGEPVVLEVNPTPAITFYDADPDGPVVTALARFLVQPKRARARG